MDSDRDKPHARLNATKRRIIKEFDPSQRGFAWVTHGREIENYIPHATLVKALESINPRYAHSAGAGRYEHAIPRLASYTYSKVRVAHEVVKHPAAFTELDLQRRMRELIAFIDEANHNAPASGQRT